MDLRYEKKFIKDIYLMFSLLPFWVISMSTDVHCSTSSDDGVCKCGDRAERGNGGKSKCGRMKRITKHTKERLWWGWHGVGLMHCHTQSRRADERNWWHEVPPTHQHHHLLAAFYSKSSFCVHFHVASSTVSFDYVLIHPLFMPIEADAFVSGLPRLLLLLLQCTQCRLLCSHSLFNTMLRGRIFQLL